MLDLIIIGGSAAATTAAIYAARRQLSFCIVSEDWGGEVATSGEIGNWPGMLETNGIVLAEAFRKHVDFYNVDVKLGMHVQKIRKDDHGVFHLDIKTANGIETMQAKTVIVTTGVHPRKLDIPGEKELYGKGVTYCTTCDGPLYKGKKVVTIGGGNSAMESALMLASIAHHVTVVNINKTFRGETILWDKIKAKSNIDIIFEADTKRIEGGNAVQRIVYKNIPSGAERTLETQGVFIHIGVIPNSTLVSDDVAKNKFGEIEVNIKSETSVPGLYAAGDVTNVPYKQIAIAAGHGVCAALSAIEYLNKQEF